MLLFNKLKTVNYFIYYFTKENYYINYFLKLYLNNQNKMMYYITIIIIILVLLILFFQSYIFYYKVVIFLNTKIIKKPIINIHAINEVFWLFIYYNLKVRKKKNEIFKDHLIEYFENLIVILITIRLLHIILRTIIYIYLYFYVNNLILTTVICLSQIIWWFILWEFIILIKIIIIEKNKVFFKIYLWIFLTYNNFKITTFIFKALLVILPKNIIINLIAYKILKNLIKLISLYL